MTEPKEEKCEACCGSGYINFWTDDGHISMRTCRRCDGYGYIKVKPKTNEEWFCELPTEEKAVIFSLLSYRCNICDGTPTNQCPFDRCVRGLKDFIKWLKEIHE